jgi:hypothetical protein
VNVCERGEAMKLMELHLPASRRPRVLALSHLSDLPPGSSSGAKVFR